MDDDRHTPDPITQLQIAPLILEEDAPQLIDIEWQPGSARLATANVEGRIDLYQIAAPQRKVRGKKLAEHKLLHSFTYHTDSCRSLVFDSTGRYLYTASADRSIGVIDTRTMELVTHKKNAHEKGINKIAFYNEHMLVSGDDDGFINIWDLRSNSTASASTAASNKAPQLKHMLHYQDAGDYISDILPMPDKNRLLVTSGDGHLYVYDMRLGHIHEMLSGKGAQNSAKLKAKGSKKCAFGSKHPLGGAVDTWFAMSDDVDDELSGVLAIKNGKKLVVAGREEGVLNIFKYDYFGLAEDHFSLGASASELEGSGASIDCMILVDQDTVITGSTDGLIRLVQVHPNKLLTILGTHEDFPIECVRMSPQQADYFESALKPEKKTKKAKKEKENDEDEEDGEDDEEDDDDDDGDVTSLVSPSGLVPRFLASSSHDQTIKFWNCSELYEVDPDEVRQEEEEESDEEQSEEEEEDESDDEQTKKKPAASKSKTPAAAAAAPLSKADMIAAIRKSQAAAAAGSKRKRDAPAEKDDSDDGDDASPAAGDDDDSSVGEYDEDAMSDVSDSSQLDGPTLADDGEEDGDSDSDNCDEGQETRDLGDEGEDDEEYDSDDDIVIDDTLDDEDDDDDDAPAVRGPPRLSLKSVKKVAAAPSAWDLFVSDVKPPETPAPVPAVPAFIAAGGNPFAMPGANPFAMPVNPFAMPTTTTTPATSTATPTTTPAPAATTTSAAVTATATPAAAAPSAKPNRWLKLAPTAAASTPAAAPAPVVAPAAPPAAKKSNALKLAPAGSSEAPVGAKPLPGSRLAPPAKKSAALRLAPAASSLDADVDEPAKKKSKSDKDLNAQTGFFKDLPAHHPMHPSQAHKRAGKAELKIEVDNIAKRGDKKRAELQELIASKKAKKERLAARRAEAEAKGEDPDLVSASEDEAPPKKGAKGKSSMKVKMVGSDDDSDDDSDDSDAGEKKPKERKLTSKQRKAQAKLEKKRNPFFSGL